MSVASALARGRAAAERLMVDTCVIRREAGRTGDADGVVTKTYTQLYSGRCRFQQPGGQARASDAGETYTLMLRLEVQLPMTAGGFEPGDEVLPDTSVDADLPGRVFLVRELAHKTHATARRLGLEERTS